MSRPGANKAFSIFPATLFKLGICLLFVISARSVRRGRATWIYFPIDEDSNGSRGPKVLQNDNMKMSDADKSSQASVVNEDIPDMTLSHWIPSRVPKRNSCHLHCALPQRKEKCIVSIDRCKCPHSDSSTCANDGVAYLNWCWFQCAKQYCNSGLQPVETRFGESCPASLTFFRS